MTTKAAFAADEWELIADSPFLVQIAMTSHRAGGGKLVGKEFTRTLEETLATVKSKSELVQEVVAINKDRVFTESPTFNIVKSKLQQIGALLEEKVDNQEEADALRTFLLAVGQKVSETTSEGMFGMGDKVSDKEIELLDTLKVALKATEADEKRRANAAQAEAKAKAEAERKQKEAKAKAEAERKKKEAKAKAESEAKAKAEAERKQKEAKAKAEAERKKREAEAKAKAEEAAKAEAERKRKEAEAKAKTEAEQKRKETETKTEPKSAKTPPEQTLRIYEVKAGDSLSKIAQAVYGDLNRWKDIYEANKDRIPNPDVIEVGQRLVLPADGSRQAESRMYEVKSGDSLSKIAQKMYGQASRWEEIFEANKDQIKDPAMIHPGQKLRIP